MIAILLKALTYEKIVKSIFANDAFNVQRWNGTRVMRKNLGEKRAKKSQVVQQPEKTVQQSERDSLVKADKAFAAARKQRSFLEDDEPPIKSNDLNENTSKAPVRPHDKHNQPVLSDAERDSQKQMAPGRKEGLMFRRQHKNSDDVGEYFSSLGRVNGWGHESSYLEAGYDVNPGFDHDSFSVKDNNHHQSSFGEKVLDFLIPAADASETTSVNQNIGGLTSEFVTDADLDASLGEKLLIGSGRAFVKTGQGIKQLGLAVGEKLGFIEDGATTTYTLAINKEKELYYGTPVGQSTAAKIGEVFTDVGMAVTVPGGSGATGVKMVVGSAGAGAVIGGLQATEDGRLFSRVQNATVGAAEGAAGGYFLNKAAQGLHWAWQKGKVQHGLHTFDSKAKEVIKPNKLTGDTGHAISKGLAKLDAKLPQPPVFSADGTALETLEAGVKGYASKQAAVSLNPRIEKLTTVIENYLGNNYRYIKNKKGDPIFINSDNTKRIRFDALYSHGDMPHGHIEYYDKALRDWVDYTGQHRIYMRKTPENLNKPIFGKD